MEENKPLAQNGETILYRPDSTTAVRGGKYN